MKKKKHEQLHLGFKDTVNYGSYYTPKFLVSIVYEMLHKNIKNFYSYKIADTSCGYGNFLQNPNSIGADCDTTALETAQNNRPLCKFFHHNSLLNVNRSQYNLNDKDSLIIVGNPPYNDRTSMIRNKIKQKKFSIDDDLRHRDLGISFLLSYDKLRADYICVLHPLSYLIKKTNFDGLRQFKNNYVLIENTIVSSGEFSAASRSTQFPIIIALYKRDKGGMTHDYICDYDFTTKDGKRFRVRQFDKLSNYITKYPNKKTTDFVAHFWTMRDINALKRAKTFIENETYDSVRVPQNKLALYCYADIFKEHIQHIPYYLGNCDIMIDYEKFEKIKDLFVKKSLRKYRFLRHLLSKNDDVEENCDLQIDNYFKNLLGEHYADDK